MASISPPAAASTFYKTLHATTIEFIHSLDKDDNTPDGMNIDRIKKIRSSIGFEHSWGHNYLVSTAPPLAAKLDIEGLIKHLCTMLPHLESWDIQITDISIDELQRRAVVRGSYFMRAKGAQETVENDLVWFLTIEEDGKKVQKSMEFLDAAGRARLMETMAMGK